MFVLALVFAAVGGAGFPHSHIWVAHKSCIQETHSINEGLSVRSHLHMRFALTPLERMPDKSSQGGPISSVARSRWTSRAAKKQSIESHVNVPKRHVLNEGSPAAVFFFARSLMCW